VRLVGILAYFLKVNLEFFINCSIFALGKGNLDEKHRTGKHSERTDEPAQEETMADAVLILSRIEVKLDKLIEILIGEIQK
jgi:hypothetical protein